MARRLGCIADDLTGASDLAGELVSMGMRTAQFIGVPEGDISGDLDAAVIALKSRSTSSALAVKDSLAAYDRLVEAGCDHIFFKYCSTFDSTEQGNIGPVLDALQRRAGENFTIACPAFPANRRTVYQGHLFVGNMLLNESGMERHPLNPMRDANLVRVLASQSSGRTGLIPLEDVRAGRIFETAARLASEQVVAAIADALDDADLAELGRFAVTRKVSSGASGLGAGIARAMMGAGRAAAPAKLPALAGRRAIISGSCSLATNRQVERMRAAHPSFRVALVSGRTAADLVAEACAWFDRQDGADPVLIYATASPEEVAQQRDLNPEASVLLEAILSEVAAHLVSGGVQSLIVAGGETSGAVVQRLGVKELRIGPAIDPGVPWAIGLGGLAPTLLLALKSGNFGTDDFMLKAWELLP